MTKINKGLRSTIIVGIVLLFTFTPVICALALNDNGKPIIALDAGHGGYDGGVSGTESKVKESVINMELVKLLKGYLESDGYKVILTRKDDVALGETKRKDMDKRVGIINQSNCILAISVHVNFYPSKYRRGIQTFYNKKIDEPLAKSIQDKLNKELNYPTLDRNFSSLWGDYYILAQTTCPSIIIETGFLSNSQDEQLLLSKSYRMVLAYHIFCGIREYLTTDISA